MKKLLFLPLLLVSFVLFAQQYGTMYVAAKSGLTFRDGPGTNFRATDNIPYGTQITILQTEEELKSHESENIVGYWQKVKHNNKTGYILDSYLLPWAPPKLSIVKEMKDYFSQVSSPFGSKLHIKKEASDLMNDSHWQMWKQLYKNGAEYHDLSGHEFGSTLYLLPGFTIQQGFLLLRLIPEFKEAIGENDAFPTTNKTIERGEHFEEYKITVEKEEFGDGYIWYNKISINYEDGAFYELKIYMMDSQLVISYGSGV